VRSNTHATHSTYSEIAAYRCRHTDSKRLFHTSYLARKAAWVDRGQQAPGMTPATTSGP
jgi:hypothetical protein